MPNYTPETKQCKSCNTTKPIIAFYSGGRDTYCKPCRLDINKDYAEKRALKTPDEREEKSTFIGRMILSERGIPCSAGSGAGLVWSDLVAWGCVPVEVKISKAQRASTGHKFKWSFSDRQRKQGFSGVFMFIAIYPDNSYCVFVIPCDDNFFTGEDGRPMNTAVSVVIGSGYANAHVWDELKQYEGAYHYIEEKRLAVSEKLAAGDTKAMIGAIAEINESDKELCDIEELPLFKSIIS